MTTTTQQHNHDNEDNHDNPAHHLPYSPNHLAAFLRPGLPAPAYRYRSAVSRTTTTVTWG
jgi:hypothetical protein